MPNTHRRRRRDSYCRVESRRQCVLNLQLAHNWFGREIKSWICWEFTQSSWLQIYGNWVTTADGWVHTARHDSTRHDTRGRWTKSMGYVICRSLSAPKPLTVTDFYPLLVNKVPRTKVVKETRISHVCCWWLLVFLGRLYGDMDTSCQSNMPPTEMSVQWARQWLVYRWQWMRQPGVSNTFRRPVTRWYRLRCSHPAFVPLTDSGCLISSSLKIYIHSE